MAKYYGVIGFVKTEEKDVPSVYEETVIRRYYRGDVLQNQKRWEPSYEQVNDNLNINNRISIVADSFAMQSLYAMKFVEFMGVAWKITNVEVAAPRIILTIGGVYNGDTGNQ